MIETRLLHYFLAVAREQSITRAAETLHISQPTLSKQMMDLENQLGKPLFVRGRKRILLTEEGAFLRSKAQEMMNLMEKTESSFRSDEDTFAGDIWFGCGETPIMSSIAKIFRELQTEYPGLKFHLYSGDTASVLEQLDKGLLDMGLLAGIPDSEKYRHIPLRQTSRLGLLIPQSSPLAQKPYITSKEILQLPLIISHQIGAVQLRDWFGQDADKLNVVATYNLLYNASFLVQQGMGYCLCLENSIQTESALTFRPLTPEISIPYYLVIKKYQFLSKSANLLLEEILHRFGSE